MNIRELYEQVPVERHREIVVSGSRLFYDGEEYLIGADGELALVHSHKALEQKLQQVLAQVQALAKS